jgi:hypothetical protein
MWRTNRYFVFLGFLLMTPSARIAIAAEPESQLPAVEDLSTRPEVFLVTEQRARECPRAGKVCLYGDGGGTVTGVGVNPTVGIVTVLARGTQIATAGAAAAVPEADAWHAEMVARLRVRTDDQPIIVAFMDYEDPDGMARKEATAVWRVDSPPVKSLGMRFVFSPENGFEPRHTYLVRVVQGEGAREKVLAEGRFLLE